MNLIFRVDGNSKIGLGHIMRCATLSSSLEEHFNIDILSKDYDIAKEFFSKNATITHLDSKEFSFLDDYLDKYEPFNTIIVVDHYELGLDWHKHVRDKGFKLFLIDDLFNKSVSADMILNQNINSSEDNYYNLNDVKDADYLIGSDYTMLRPEFTNQVDLISRNKTVKNILITMGGADGKNQSPRIIESLNGSQFIYNITVVVGKAAKNLEDIKRVCELSKHKCFIVVNATNMAELFSKSDVAIGAGGISNYERCCLGLPSLIMATSDNQIESCEKLSELKCIQYIGLWNTIKDNELKDKIEQFLSNDKLHKLLSDNGSKVFDGHGISRIVAKLKSLI